MPAFDPKLSLGNIIAISVIVIGGIATFAKLETSYLYLEKRVIRAEQENKESESRVMERLDDLHQDVREIRSTQMKQMNRQ